MVYEKLSKARTLLLSKNLKKSGHNKYAGYTYFELGDFLPEVLKIFDELKLFAAIDFSDCCGEFPTAKLRIIDCEDQSNIVFSSPYGTAALKGCHDIQNKGAEQTYLRRYLWVQAMEIVEHDAIESVTGSDTNKKATFNTPKNEVPNPKSVVKTDFDNLSPEDQKIVLDWAVNIYDAFAVSDKEAYDLLMNFGKTYKDRDNSIEMNTGLWCQLNTKQRAAIKRIKMENNVTANAPDNAKAQIGA